MGATEDELAKKTIQEAIWTWAGRVIVLVVTFGFGFFAAWVLWGQGTQGAPTLRERVVELEAQVVDLKNQRLDVKGRLTVAEGRQEQCQRALTDARTKLVEAQAAAQKAAGE